MIHRLPRKAFEGQVDLVEWGEDRQVLAGLRPAATSMILFAGCPQKAPGRRPQVIPSSKTLSQSDEGMPARPQNGRDRTLAAVRERALLNDE
jgi:hypothetical protein